MTRRRLMMIAFLLVLAIGVVVVWHLTRPEPVINVERARLIQTGMSEQQVTAILGGPPGDYTGDQIVTYSRGGVGADESGYYSGTNWWGLEGVVQVHFNQGLVENVNYYPAKFARQVDPWQTIRSLVTLRGKRNRHDWVPAHW